MDTKWGKKTRNRIEEDGDEKQAHACILNTAPAFNCLFPWACQLGDWRFFLMTNWLHVVLSTKFFWFEGSTTDGTERIGSSGKVTGLGRFSGLVGRPRSSGGGGGSVDERGCNGGIGGGGGGGGPTRNSSSARLEDADAADERDTLFQSPDVDREGHNLIRAVLLLLHVLLFFFNDLQQAACLAFECFFSPPPTLFLA